MKSAANAHWHQSLCLWGKFPNSLVGINHPKLGKFLKFPRGTKVSPREHWCPASFSIHHCLKLNSLKLGIPHSLISPWTKGCFSLLLHLSEPQIYLLGLMQEMLDFRVKDFRVQGFPFGTHQHWFRKDNLFLSPQYFRFCSLLSLTFPHCLLPRINTRSAARIPCSPGKQFPIKSPQGRFWMRSGGNVVLATGWFLLTQAQL